MLTHTACLRGFLRTGIWDIYITIACAHQSTREKNVKVCISSARVYLLAGLANERQIFEANDLSV